MYAYISGTVAYKGQGKVVIDNNGIGYNIMASNDCISKLPAIGAKTKLFTHLQVTEDAHNLFGFTEMNEKEMFLKLISISGIGCKLAVQVLSGITTVNLAIAIANADIKALSQIKGIGKKTAERIVLELKEKVDLSDITIPGGTVIDIADQAVSDAIMALVSLGIGKTEAAKAVAKAREVSDKTDKIITIALRSLDN